MRSSMDSATPLPCVTVCQAKQVYENLLSVLVRAELVFLAR
jgi:hypothetical protein